MERILKHYSVDDLVSYLMKVTPAKSVIVSKGETADEMDVSFMLPSRIHNICDVLKFVYSSNNLSFKICGTSTALNSTYIIKVDLSLPF